MPFVKKNVLEIIEIILNGIFEIILNGIFVLNKKSI